MKSTYPKTAKDIKGPVVIAELRRAHYIITILAISFAAIIAFVTAFQVQFSATLGVIAIVMLLCVAAVSLATAFVLRRR